MDAKDTLLRQNARFYEAFENKQLEVMDDIWSHSPSVRCIHPGWSVLEGRDEVMKSWARVFEGETKLKISLRSVRAEVEGRIGIVVLMEEISTHTGKLSNTSIIMATNIFEHNGTEWKMIHHHGSPMVVVEEQEGENFRLN